jgi:saccharopine dehydrogenase-like NADP-dependent oxidoreductase
MIVQFNNIYDVTSYSVKKCTAAPAAIAALMILDGKIDMKGVFAPEGVFEIGDYDTKMNNIIKIEETESNGYI